MAKLTLTDLSDLRNQTIATNTLNDNFARIEEAIEDAVLRSGTGDNSLAADLDLNSNDIINAATIYADNIVVGGIPVTDIDAQLLQGPSAYDIAVDNGFVGTEVEWLNSLHGQDGADGADGPAGTPGAGVSDGDKGDIVVSSNGATWTIDPIGTSKLGGDITTAGKALLDDASASAQLTTLGVSTYAKTLLDDADAATARTTLGLGTAATIADSTLVHKTTAEQITGKKEFKASVMGTDHIGTANLGGEIVVSSIAAGGGAAAMTFNLTDAFGVNFGLETDGTLRVGGGSLAPNSYKIFHEGNIPSVSYGGTGATSASSARSNLGLSIGTDVTGIQSSNVTYTIPTNFSTLQSAIDTLSKLHRPSGVTITLNIATGHKITAPLLLRDGNYGHFRITSTDTEVKLAPGFTGQAEISPDTMDGPDGFKAAIYIHNAVAPVWCTKLNMENNSGTKVGIFVGNCSSMVVEPGFGVINAYETNMWVSGSSHLTARLGVFTGAGSEGLRARINANVNVAEANFDNCCARGLGSGNALFISRGSVAYCNEATARNSGANGVAIHRSLASLEGMIVTGSASHGLEVDNGAIVHAGEGSTVGINLNNSGVYGARVQGGSVLNLHNASIRNAGTKAIYIRQGARINAAQVDVNNTSDFVDGVSTNTLSANGIVHSNYTASSDERIKENFQEFESGAILDAINMYKFNWKDGGAIGYGVKAQELYKVFPEAVYKGDDGSLDDEGSCLWSVDYSKLVPLLVKEVQELRNRVKELEK